MSFTHQVAAHKNKSSPLSRAFICGTCASASTDGCCYVGVSVLLRSGWASEQQMIGNGAAHFLKTCLSSSVLTQINSKGMKWNNRSTAGLEHPGGKIILLVVCFIAARLFVTSDLLTAETASHRANSGIFKAQCC